MTQSTLTLMVGLRPDVRYALRAGARSPLPTLVAAISLELAIGANSTNFSLVSAAPLHPLPAEDPEALVRIGATDNGVGFSALSYAEFEAIGRARSLRGVLAHQMHNAILDFGAGPSETTVEIVSDDYFRVLGLRPLLGRFFTAARGGGEPADAVVVGDAFWRGRLAGRGDILGAAVRINGRSHPVVGVAPAGFWGTFPGFRIEVRVPLRTGESVLGRGITRTSRFRFLHES